MRMIFGAAGFVVAGVLFWFIGGVATAFANWVAKSSGESAGQVAWVIAALALLIGDLAFGDYIAHLGG